MRYTSSIMALAIALAGTGCYTMKPVTMDDLSMARTKRVWVTRPDQSTVIINDAQIFRGKLAGFVDGKYQELPPDHLQQMKVRKLSTARTVGLITLVAAVGTTVAVMMSGDEGDFDPCIGDDGCEDALRLHP
jgi:hypothetical protein